jgi:hypothetical protein
MLFLGRRLRGNGSHSIARFTCCISRHNQNAGLSRHEKIGLDFEAHRAMAFARRRREPRSVDLDLASAVAESRHCLLQYVKSVHRTAENIAASLHPGVAGIRTLSRWFRTSRSACTSLASTFAFRHSR